MRSPAKLLLFCCLFFLSADLFSQFELNGDATDIGNNCFRLTSDRDTEIGSVFNQTSIDLRESFFVDALLNFGDKNRTGADGIAFVLARTPNAIGISGEGLGYSGINPSLIAEFDDWTNGNRGDPNFDHFSIMQNGNPDHGSNDNLAGPRTLDNIEDGDDHCFSISWNADIQLLTVIFDGARLTYLGDVVNDIFGGNPIVHWGFTASTGGSSNEQVVCINFSSNNFQPMGTQQICLGDTLTLQPDPNGLDYTWQSDPTLDNPNTQNPRVFPTTNTTYYLEIEYPCQSKTIDSVLVEVLNPMISLEPIAAQCVSNAPIQLNFSPTGGTFDGMVSTSGEFDPMAAGVGIHDIKYTYSEMGCELDSTITIVVNALPNFTLDPVPELCENESMYAIVHSPAGGNWTGAATNSGVVFPNQLGAGTFPATYSFTDTNGCTDSTKVDIIINSKPAVDISAIAPLCINSDSISLSANPIGGTWTGVDQMGGFNPATFGFGDVEVIYTFEDSRGCIGSDTTLVSVNDLPQIAIDNPDAYCENDMISSLSANPIGGTWAGDVAANGEFDPMVLQNGTYQAFYEYTDANNCSNQDSIFFTIFPIPLPEIDPVGPFCESDTPIQLTVNLSGGGWSGDVSPNGQFNPTLANIGTNKVYYEDTNQFLCSNIDSIEITVFADPEIQLISDSAFCQSDVMAQLEATPAGGEWFGIVDSVGELIPSDLGIGTYIASYFFTNPNGCSDQKNIQVEILESTPVDFSNIGPFCQNIDNQIVIANPSGGTFSGAASNTGEVTPADLSIGNHDLNYLFADSRGCITDTTFQIEILEVPVTMIAAPDSICPNGARVQFDGSPLSGIWSGDVDANGAINPTDLTPGNYSASYFFTNALGCKDSTEVDFVIRESADIFFTNTGPFCLTDDVETIVPNLPGGTWSGDVSADGSFTPSDLGDGLYKVFYTYIDAAGCESITEADFEILTPIDLIFGNDKFCIDDGQITFAVDPIGGSWSGSNITSDGEINTADFAAGNYTVTYTFSQQPSNCEFEKDFTFTILPLPDVKITGDDIFCQTLDNQTFTANLSNGTWSGAVDQDGVLDPTQLTVGDHTIRYDFTSSDNCTNFDEKTIEITAPPSVIDFEDASICMDGTGADLQILLDGTGPFNIQISDGTNSETLANFSSGDIYQVNPQQTTTYTITSIEDTRCADDASTTSTVTVNTPPEATLETSAQICSSDRTGEPTVLNFDDLILSGDATGSWTDLDNSGATGSFPMLDFDNTTPGQFRFRYTTGAAQAPCMNQSYEILVFVLDCTCPSVATLPIDPVCNDNGQINLDDITVTNESGIWQITNQPPGSSPSLSGNIFDLTNSQSGDYELTFTIDRAPLPECPDSSVQVVTVFEPPTATLELTAETCNSDEVGDPTSIDFSTLILAGDMTGTWTDLDNSGATGSFQNLDFNGGVAGQYRFEYRTNTAQAPCDDFVGEVLLTLNECRCPGNAIDPISPMCNDDARIDLNDFDQSTEPGTWSLTNQPAGANANLNGTIFDATGAPSGDYELTFTLTQTPRPGCPQSSTQVVTVSEFVTAGSFANDLEICNDETPIDLNTLLQGATPSGEWIDVSASSAGALFSNGILTTQNLPEGEYQFQYAVNTAAPCLNDTATIFIKIENSVEAGSPVSDLNVCEGIDTLVQLADLIRGNDLGGVWSDISTNPILSLDLDSPFNLFDLPKGKYEFQYKMATQKICPEDSTSVKININETPIADAGNTFEITCDDPEATLGGNSTTGADIVYSWSGTVDDPTVANTTTRRADIYTLEVINSVTGCKSTDNVEITSAADLPILMASSISITCFGDNDGVIEIVDVSGGMPPYLFSLNDGTFINSNIFSNLSPGDYNLKVEDVNGCSDELDFSISEPDELNVTLTTTLSGNSNIIILGDSTQLVAQVQGGFDSIEWSPADVLIGCPPGVDFMDCLTQWVAPQEATTYQVRVMDENGCADEASLRLEVEKIRRVFFPSAFSPNNDGINDTFFPFSDGAVVEVKSFQIYDRWGGQVFINSNFESNDSSAGWDGTHRGKLMNSGVYTFFAEIEFIDGLVEIFKGDVSLLR